MKIVNVFLLSLLFVCLSSFSSCSVKYAPPKGEVCIHNQDNSAECTDLRKPEVDRQYTKLDLTNNICTNPPDYERYFNYCSDLRSKLIKCENQRK